ncbi:MAG: RSP_7527 family protein [Reyranella sp.]
MFSAPYPTPAERQTYATRAHRLRSAVVAGLVRDLVRWVSAAAR